VWYDTLKYLIELFLGTVRIVDPKQRLLWPKHHAAHYCSNQANHFIVTKKNPRQPTHAWGFWVAVASTRLLAGRRRGVGG
jgi:hypothetical protein